MRLLKLKLDSGYHSLQEGFEMIFHDPETEIDNLADFHPLCFAGLNGSGKSNILEVLANIFYHLECCMLKNKPRNFNFNPNHCIPDAFELTYLIELKTKSVREHDNLYHVRIKKKNNAKPVVFVRPYLHSENKEEKVELKYQEIHGISPAKEFLPDFVIAYSSGENEIISRPFLKTQLIQYDEYISFIENGVEYERPESNLIYMDYAMCQTILLTNLLYQSKETVRHLETIIGLSGLASFRMNINLHTYEIENRERREKQNKDYRLINQIRPQIDKLKKCATSFFEINNNLVLDFFVNAATKQAVKTIFGEDPFDLFNVLYVLQILNRRIIETEVKTDVYSSKGYYTSGKLPEPEPSEQTFHFLNYFVNVKQDADSENKKLLIRQLSDGEQQFLHTMSICILLKDYRTLILLDEPETHFNPEWRSKFMQILSNSMDGISALRKEIILTTHSPFIISDCKAEDVMFFEKTQAGKVSVSTAKDRGINTYGASVDFLLEHFFNMRLIADKAFEELKKVIESDDLSRVISAVDDFGESSEKQFLYQRIYELKKREDVVSHP